MDSQSLTQHINDALQLSMQAIENYHVTSHEVYSDPFVHQQNVYVAYVAVHNAQQKYLNLIYQFKCSLTDAIQLPVSYLEVVGFFLPNTTQGIYLQVVFDGECDTQLTMAFNNQYQMNIGGLPFGTVIFTNKETYILEGDELVKFKI